MADERSDSDKFTFDDSRALAIEMNRRAALSSNPEGRKRYEIMSDGWWLVAVLAYFEEEG
jgi:hypothetical protein